MHRRRFAWIVGAVLAGCGPCSDHPEAPEALQPEDGRFGGDRFGYEAAVAQLLVGEHDRRECQMVFMPSFVTESLVFIVPSDASEMATVVAKEPEQQIWGAMSNAVAAPVVADASVAAAEETYRMPNIMRWEAPIDAETASVLAQVWAKALSGTRYPEDPIEGLDGETYHVAHFATGVGYRFGQTWSPPPGTVLADFVDLGMALRDYPRKRESERDRFAHALREDARRVLANLKRVRAN